MAAGRRVYRCLCNSSDYELDSNNIATCTHCGKQFVIQDECSKIKILPKIDKSQFIRSAWIYLAREDAPIDIFDYNFEDVKTIEYQLILDIVDVIVPYQVTVGCDRQEPYIAYESYYEKEPYLTTERVYNRDLKIYETRQITKYRNVKKERQVTKYKTVTDWSPFSGEHKTTSQVSIENNKGVFTSTFDTADNQEGASEIIGAVTLAKSSDRENENACIAFDKNIFWECMKGLDGDYFVPPTNEDCERMTITNFSKIMVEMEHDKKIDSSLKGAIPGDHYRNLDYRVEVEENTTFLLLVPEFVATISYNGENYTKRVYPFGKILPNGKKIENENGVNAFKAVKSEGSEVRGKELNNEYSEKKWRKNKGFFLSATVLLALSIVCSVVFAVAIPVLSIALPLVLVLFVAAVIAFVLSKVLVNKNEDRINSEEYRAMANEHKETQQEIDAFLSDYKAKQLELLNKKLASLGLEPATLDEIQ